MVFSAAEGGRIMEGVSEGILGRKRGEKIGRMKERKKRPTYMSSFHLNGLTGLKGTW